MRHEDFNIRKIPVFAGMTVGGVGLGANKRLEGIRRLFGVGRIGRIGRIGRVRKGYDSTLVGAKNLSPG
jgi:hypothetical protein